MIGPALSLSLALAGLQDAPPAKPVPTYSLVVANLTGGFRTDQSSCGPGKILCDNWSIAGFEQATVLFGAPLPKAFGAYLVLHMPERQVPSLVVVATVGEDHQIISRSRGYKTDGIGCVRRVELPDGWVPSGAGITVSDDEICASVAGIKIEPLPVINVLPPHAAKSKPSKK